MRKAVATLNPSCARSVRCWQVNVRADLTNPGGVVTCRAGYRQHIIIIVIITFYAVITIAIRVRYDYDPTTTYRARQLPFDAIQREQKMNMPFFHRSLAVVASQSNRTQIVISITSVVVECVVVSSYRSRIAIVI